MTKGKPVPVIVRFCLPVLLGCLLQQSYNLADIAIIGRFIGMDEMGAVSATGSLNFLVIGFVLGLTNGFCIPIAQTFGAGNVSEMRRYAVNAFYLCGMFAAALTALTMIFTRPLLEIMNTPAETIESAHSYIIVLFGGITAIILYNIFAGLLRALGDSKTPLYFLIISCVISVILDLVFILGFNMGTAGAGWATVVAQIFSVVLCAVYLRKNYSVLLFKKDELKFSRKRCAKLISNGVPMALQFSITAVGSVILQSAVNDLGKVAVSAVGMASKIQVFLMQPMETLGITMATFCAQNLGAGKILRVKKGIRLGIVMVSVYSVVAGLLVFFAGRYMAMIFVSRSEENLTEALDYVTRLLRVNGSLYWILGILFVIRNSVQGLGYGTVTMLAGVSELVARACVASLVTVYGFNAVCFANPFAWFLADVMLIVIFVFLMKKLSKTPRKNF
ncbi:MAG: MATE family efflux transporter [Oscillospiraceae bacterium]|nr:MATE family efflux transporter [Oscillospiraceae bacterium]